MSSEIMHSSSCPKSGLKPEVTGTEGRPKVLLVIGDGAEVLDTMVPFYRLGEEFQVIVAGPEPRKYHLVLHEMVEGWDITQERPGYHLDADVAFRDVRTRDYVGLILPGGRAPEYLRYDIDLVRITREFFADNRPVASICHGIEILAAADVIREREVTTIPKCRFDAEVCGAIYGADPVVRSGNLICARGKKDISPWLREFVQMIHFQVTSGDCTQE
jgi:protease I